MLKSVIAIFFVVLSVLPPLLAHAQAPRQIAAFILGEDIETCKAYLQMETMMPIRYRPYLREVQIKSTEGFKTGLITFENCLQPDRIVRIKMKYADPSKAFYQKLLERFKKRFGDDPEWRGDPFHIFLAWKWSFVDDQGNRISLILQHNIKDQEEKRGNSVKMTLINALNEAQACYESRQRKEEASSQAKQPIDWGQLIPR